MKKPEPWPVTRLRCAGCALLVRQTIRHVHRHAESTEEPLHRRALAERRIAFERHRCGAGIHLDADRDDGRLHLLDDVGKADRPLRGLGIGGAGERKVASAAEIRGRPTAASRRGRDAGQERDPTRTEEAGLLSGSSARNSVLILHLSVESAPKAPLVRAKMGRAPLRRAVGEIKLW